MAVDIPTAFDRVEIRLISALLSGKTVNGKVTFTPTPGVRLVHTATKVGVYAVPIVGKVLDGVLYDEAGSGPCRLYASDDPDMSSPLGPYNVKIEFDGTIAEQFSLVVPVAAKNVGIDLHLVARSAPVNPAPPSEQYVTTVAFSSLDDRVTSLEEGGGGGGGGGGSHFDTDGNLLVDDLPNGVPVFVIKALPYYGAANAWPTTRPTTRPGVPVVWIGNDDPGSIALPYDQRWISA